MFKEHISRIEAINESHKKINGQIKNKNIKIRNRSKRVKTKKVEDDKELIQSLYDYP